MITDQRTRHLTHTIPSATNLWNQINCARWDNIWAMSSNLLRVYRWFTITILWIYEKFIRKRIVNSAVLIFAFVNEGDAIKYIFTGIPFTNYIIDELKMPTLKKSMGERSNKKNWCLTSLSALELCRKNFFLLVKLDNFQLTYPHENFYRNFILSSSKTTWEVGAKITNNIFFVPKVIEIPAESDGILEITYDPVRMTTDEPDEVSS